MFVCLFCIGVRSERLSARVSATALNYAATLALVLTLGGCAQFWMVSPADAPVAEAKNLPGNMPLESRGVDDWLRFADSMRRASSTEFAREMEQARLAFNHDKSDWRRLQYGYLLLLPNHKQHDVLRALAVLEPVARDNRNLDGELRPMAGLLYAMASEQQRLEDALEQSQQKLREEQRRADAAEQRATQALIKLDTLRALEQNLYHRRDKVKN